MKKKSLAFSITLAFSALFVFLILSFTILIGSMEKRERFHKEKKSFDIAHFVLKEQNAGEFLDFFGFKLVKNQDLILQSKSLETLWHSKKRKLELIRFKDNAQEYLLIKHPKKTLLLQDLEQSKSLTLYVGIIFVLLLFAFLFLYFRILNKLKPLTSLTQKIQSFGDEKFEIECAIDADDEIATLANEFEKAAKKLKNIKESRNIFIRNIMHELKTPIAKGQFLTQLDDSPQNRALMQEVFYRLEALINEFASIEELITTQNILERKEYKLLDVLDNAIDLLLCDESAITQEIDDVKIEVNFKFFTIAIKNLLDNGLKYSSNKSVLIKNSKKKILIQSRGEVLKNPLGFYFEPFSKTQQNSPQGFGLGLYIVKHILDAHGFTLEYTYEEGVNTFLISLE